MTGLYAPSATGYPTERDYIAPGELGCHCALSTLLPKHRDLWNWANSALVHGAASQAQIAERCLRDAPQCKSITPSRVSHHYRRHLHPWLLARPEYLIRSELMEELAQVAAEGGMSLPEIMEMHARLAGLVMTARSVEAWGELDAAQLVREAREAASAADMAASRAVDRARKSLGTQEGQKKLFALWREQFADELARDRGAFESLKKLVARRRKELGV